MHDASPTARARVLAVFYLGLIACGIVGQAVIADAIVVPNDPARTAANIVANTTRYRIAFTLFLIEQAAQFVVTAMFYDLLAPVDRGLARIGAIMGLVGSGFKTFARVFYYVPLLLVGGASWVAGMEPTQREILALLMVKISSVGASVALVFFGFETIVRGWLIVRSAFLPRVLGIVSMIGGIGWLAYLWPPLGAQVFIYVALFAIVSVILTTGWFFVRGVDDTAWRARAALAATAAFR